jgi:hypothetical protein
LIVERRGRAVAGLGDGAFGHFVALDEQHDGNEDPEHCRAHERAAPTELAVHQEQGGRRDRAPGKTGKGVGGIGLADALG